MGTLQHEAKEIKDSQDRCGLRSCGNQVSSDSELRHYSNGRWWLGDSRCTLDSYFCFFKVFM